MGQTSEVRPCTRDDLPQVTRLFEQVMRSGSSAPPPGLAGYFERTLFDYPWVDPEIPSLVYEQNGVIVAFLGSHVRRLVLDGAPIRMACSGQFVSSPAMQKRGGGALLLRKYLAGPQELTITDGASAPVGRMWERLKGQTVWLNSLTWTRIFRPWSAIGTLFGSPEPTSWRRAAAILGRPADALITRLAGEKLRVPEPATGSEELTSAALLEMFPRVVCGHALYPAYDRPFVDWLFSELASVESRGRLVKRLVTAGNGRPLGWYVAYLPRALRDRHGPREAVAQALQIAAAPANVEAVLQHLLHHAQISGATAIQGRLEPHLFEAVRQPRYLLRRTQLALIHSRARPDAVSAVFEGRALLTRMDGEWWMSHHIDAFR